MAEKWHEGHVAGFDCESTGVDPHTVRIVTASVVHVKPGARPRAIEWIIDPVVDVPDEAAAVHGWTREKILDRVGGEHMAVRVTNDGAHEMRMTRDAALFELAGQLGVLFGTDTPVVVANAAYDFTLLEADLARNGVDTLSSRPLQIRGVVDPMVLEKQYDTYRRTCYKKAADGTLCDRENGVHVCGGCRGGKHKCAVDGRGCGMVDRRLESLCRHYGVPLTVAHSSTADALAAVRLTKRLAGLWPDIARLKLSTVHQKQVEWRHQQQLGLKQFFQDLGERDKAAEVCGEWPLHSRCGVREAVA